MLIVLMALESTGRARYGGHERYVAMMTRCGAVTLTLGEDVKHD